MPVDSDNSSRSMGICSVIDYFAKRKKAKAEQSEAIMGTLGLVVGIAAAVISILAMFMRA